MNAGLLAAKDQILKKKKSVISINSVCHKTKPTYTDGCMLALGFFFNP